MDSCHYAIPVINSQNHTMCFHHGSQIKVVLFSPPAPLILQQLQLPPHKNYLLEPNSMTEVDISTGIIVYREVASYININ